MRLACAGLTQAQGGGRGQSESGLQPGALRLARDPWVTLRLQRAVAVAGLVDCWPSWVENLPPMEYNGRQCASGGTMKHIARGARPPRTRRLGSMQDSKMGRSWDIYSRLRTGSRECGHFVLLRTRSEATRTHGRFSGSH